MNGNENPLGRMVGRWTARQEAPQSKFPRNLKAVIQSFDDDAPSEVNDVHAEMILDGSFLQLSFSGTFQGKSFTTTGLVGFDRSKKEYMEFWTNNFGLVHYVSTSDYQVSGSSLRMEHRNVKNADGDLAQSRSVYELRDDRSFTHRLTRLHPDGSEETVKFTHFSKVA